MPKISRTDPYLAKKLTVVLLAGVIIWAGYEKKHANELAFVESIQQVQLSATAEKTTKAIAVQNDEALPEALKALGVKTMTVIVDAPLNAMRTSQVYAAIPDEPQASKGQAATPAPVRKKASFFSANKKMPSMSELEALWATWDGQDRRDALKEYIAVNRMTCKKSGKSDAQEIEELAPKIVTLDMVISIGLKSYCSYPKGSKMQIASTPTTSTSNNAP